MMDVSAYEDLVSQIQGFNVHFKQFKRRYFKSNKTYSRLMLSEDFCHPTRAPRYLPVPAPQEI